MLLWADRVSRAFGARPIYGPLSFELEDGRVLGIAGANGAGKTTLLKTLAGFLRPSSGQVLYAASRADASPSLSPRAARRLIGWAAPDLTLYGELTAAENLTFFAKVGGLDSSPSSIDAALEDVGLDPTRIARKESRLLSTGQRQRLKLAFATLSSPLVLLLDEPGSNLDEAGRAIVAKVVARQRRQGAAVLASNDPRDLGLADTTLPIS